MQLAYLSIWKLWRLFSKDPSVKNPFLTCLFLPSKPTTIFPTLEFLSYHVVNGSYYSNDLRDGQFIPTLLGDNQIQVGIRVDHCSRRLIDANVSPLYKTDIPSSNGVIHIVSNRR